MSSALTQLVPVFDGSSWQAWADALEAFLMSQSLWTCVSEAAVEEPTAPAADAEEAVRDAYDTAKTAYDAWKKSNVQAMGTIRLRLTPSVAQRVRSKATAKEMWDQLKEDFGAMSVGQLYHELKAALDLRLPTNSDPSAAIERFMEHFERLTAADTVIPKLAIGLILLAKAPAYADAVVALTSQVQDKSDIDAKVIGRMIVNSWEQRQFKPQGRQHNASRVSAIKKKKGGDPNFQQQQRPSGQ